MLEKFIYLPVQGCVPYISNNERHTRMVIYHNELQIFIIIRINKNEFQLLYHLEIQIMMRQDGLLSQHIRFNNVIKT